MAFVQTVPVWVSVAIVAVAGQVLSQHHGGDNRLDDRATVGSPRSTLNVSFEPFGGSIMNPMRGFRHQIDNLCGDTDDPSGRNHVRDGLETCAKLNLTVSLTYCYLSPWWNQTLPPKMLSNLHDRLSEMREAGVSALLNVAYEDGKTNFLSDVEPFSFDRIYGHIDQLAPVLRANADVIYGMQAGFIGNAGEWAHDIRGLLTNASGVAGLVSRLLYGGALSDDRQVLIRTGPEKLHMLQGSPFAKCETHDGHRICSGAGSDTRGRAQHLVGVDPRWKYGVVDSSSAYSENAFARLGQYNAAFMSIRSQIEDGTMTNPWFAYFEREGPYVAVDGEMYYGTPWPEKQRLLVEGHAAAQRMMQHSFNTFSHHNSYYPLDSEATPDPKNKSLNVWMTTPLNMSWLQEHQMPFTSAFATASAQSGGTVADYIREHLGYRLELTTAQASSVQTDTAAQRSGLSHWNLTLQLRLTNRGFSAPVNRRVWILHLLDLTTNQSIGHALAEPSLAPDWRVFYPTIPGDPLRTTTEHIATLNATMSNVNPGRYWLGFSLVDPLAVKGHSSETEAKHAVRFTNTAWMSGVNVVGCIEMQTIV